MDNWEGLFEDRTSKLLSMVTGRTEPRKIKKNLFTDTLELHRKKKTLKVSKSSFPSRKKKTELNEGFILVKMPDGNYELKSSEGTSEKGKASEGSPQKKDQQEEEEEARQDGIFTEEASHEDKIDPLPSPSSFSIYDDIEPLFEPSPAQSSKGSIINVDQVSDHEASPAISEVVEYQSLLDDTDSPIDGSCARARNFVTLCLGNSLSKKPKKRFDRRNACAFCGELVTNFVRHLKNNHPMEEEVQEIFNIVHDNIVIQRKLRSSATAKLRLRGNHMHNLAAADKGKSLDFIPVKRYARKKIFSAMTSSSHFVCQFCNGMYRKDTLYLHYRKCKKRPEESSDDKARVLKVSALILTKNTKSASDSLLKMVYPRMQSDDISIAAKEDGLIAKFGSRFFNNHRSLHQVKHVSLKMRDLARILIHMKAEDDDIGSFYDCVQPYNFDQLMAAVRSLSKFDETTGDVKNMTFPNRVRSSLLKCHDIIVSDVNKLLNPSPNKLARLTSMRAFKHLMDKDWAVEIGSNAEKSKKKQHLEKEVLMPEEKDILAVSEGIGKLYEPLIEKLKNGQLPNLFVELTKLLYAHVLIFNRRRPGELARAPLDGYERDRANPELQAGSGKAHGILTTEQSEENKDVSLFYIIGKGTRAVPVLLTAEMRETLHFLIDVRGQYIDKKVDSGLLFPQLSSALPYDGTKVLDYIKKKFNLVKPDHFKATGLRHHIATASQLHERDDTLTENLATFMGHDVRIHTGIYRKPLPLVQKLQVGQRLRKYIQPSSTITCPQSQVPLDLFESEAPSTDLSVASDTSETATPHPASPVATHMCEPTDPPSACPVADGLSEISNSASVEKDSDYNPDSEAESLSSEFSENEQITIKSGKKKIYAHQLPDSSCEEKSVGKKIIHKKFCWTDNELKIIYKYFKSQIDSLTTVPRQTVKAMYNQERIFHRRTFASVNATINNYTTGKKKMPEHL